MFDSTIKAGVVKKAYALLLFSFIGSCVSVPSVSEPAIRIACVGDSITYGAGLKKGGKYPAVLRDLLGERYAVRNFGLNGATLPSMEIFRMPGNRPIRI